MSASAIAAAAPPQRQRVAVILAFWLATASLIAGQYALLRTLGWFNSTLAETGRFALMPSPWWRLVGTLLPLLLAGTALTLQRRWLGEIWSNLAWIGLCALVPFGALCLLFAYVSGPRTVETMHVGDGRKVVLAVEEGMDGYWFVLFEEADPGGFVWRRIADLDDLEDPPRAGRPQLVATPGGGWLLVRRNGNWTDGFRLVDGHPVAIDDLLTMPAGRIGNAALVRLRSARIAALTGARP